MSRQVDYRLMCLVDRNLTLDEDYEATQWFGGVTKEKAEKLFKSNKFINSLTGFIKWNIVVHKLMLEQFRGNQWFQKKFMENNIVDPQNIMRIKKIEGMDEIKLMQLLKQYDRYIKKRVITMGEFLWNSDKSNNIVSQQNQTQDKLTDCYLLINLIKTGTSFRNYFFYFGRYNKQKYKFVQDINILMGKDLQQIYNNLKMIFDSLQSDYIDLSQMMKNSVDSLTNQIQTLNQQLNVIYYNTYYYKSLKPFIPNWIKILKCLKKTPKKKSLKQAEQIDKLIDLKRRITSHETCENSFDVKQSDNNGGILNEILQYFQNKTTIN